MMLHFPPAAIKDLKNGDTITVQAGIRQGHAGQVGRLAVAAYMQGPDDIRPLCFIARLEIGWHAPRREGIMSIPWGERLQP